MKTKALFSQQDWNLRSCKKRWYSFDSSLNFLPEELVLLNNYLLQQQKNSFESFCFLVCYCILCPSSVGNAMGYIRMIRSGGLHCCSNAIRYNVVHSC